MDKNAIKKFAVWARNELIKRVNRRAQEYKISEHHIGKEEECLIDGRPLTKCECEMRRSLVSRIQRNGYQPTMEAVAYTWFNRFCALRFMEVNGYLPSKVRIFTDENNQFNPQILTEAIHLGDRFDHIDMNRVFSLIEKANAQNELYQYLIITQCNELKEVLPGIFTKIEDYTELLFPENLLDKDSVIGHLISDIPEEYFRVDSKHGQIEIIGWLYQYYISEKHEAVIDPLHGKVICAEDVPAATQLFTTDWVVRYIVDNSV
ncbi:MAG: SAM-dependent methyltransferase, partial [Proteobacteria bacterium]|nr:SAM-dependent methyltransferase [Pseudomonadota bacterium]